MALITSMVGANAAVIDSAPTLASRLARLSFRKLLEFNACRLNAWATRAPEIFCSNSELTPLIVLRVSRNALRARFEKIAVLMYISGSSRKLANASRQLSHSIPIRIANSIRKLDTSRDRPQPTTRLITSMSLVRRDSRSPASCRSK